VVQVKFKADQTDQKLRGGYYTPQDIADYVARWVLRASPSSILEPSCGDGVFISALHHSNCEKSIKLQGFELFDSEVKKTKAKCKEYGFKNADIVEGDFLSWASDAVASQSEIFDGVVGNPPFIRYQFLEKNFQINAEKIFTNLGLKFTKHTNSWVPFVLSSISMLKPGGRLGMVIPSEIIHVMHAQSLRDYLLQSCSKVVIIDPQEIWFEDTLQGAVIIFAEKKLSQNKKSKGVAIKHVKGFDFLNKSAEAVFTRTKAVDAGSLSGKWTKVSLEEDERKLLEKIIRKNKVFSFDEIASVEVGIVTGANNFFLVDDETVEKYGLEKYASPMFGKSLHCKGVIYDKGQHNDNKKNGLPTNFLYLDKEYAKLPANVQKYIDYGEDQNLHSRYKCRIREPWYKVPSVFSRNLGMLKRSHDTPRLIYNELEAYTTDTAYRVTSKGIDPKYFSYLFLNPLTAVFAELEGRYYGGGVLELVPSEIRKLYIPVPDSLDYDLKDLDSKIRNYSMDSVLRLQGEKILGAIGLTKKEIEMVYIMWEKLKNRRQRK
jgi:adenine-specific DNA-methyltransferase